MVFDNHFWRGEPLPDDLANLPQHIEERIEYHRGPSQRLASARSLLLRGSRIPPRLADMVSAHGYPVLHGGARTLASFTIWIDNLKMLETYVDARVAYSEALFLEESADIAEVLVELDRIAPDIVTALLELRIGRAFDLMQLLGLRQDDASDARGCLDCDYLIKAMFGVRIAWWLRIEAVLCASRLRRPTGWFPLDHCDRPDMVRYGILHKRYLRELVRVDKVIKIYRSGEPVSGDFDGKSPGEYLETTLGFPTWYKDFRRSDERSRSQWDGIVHRAQDQLPLWQNRHGVNFEAVLDAQITHIERQLPLMMAFAKEHEPTRRTFNMLAGNEKFADPLCHLYHLTRFAVAWTCPYGTSGFMNQDPLSHAISWLTTSPKNPWRCPHPTLGRVRALEVDRVFTIPRYSIVSDGNMLPAQLRTPKCAGSKRRQAAAVVTSQWQATRATGRPCTLSELMTPFWLTHIDAARFGSARR